MAIGTINDEKGEVELLPRANGRFPGFRNVSLLGKDVIQLVSRESMLQLLSTPSSGNPRQTKKLSIPPLEININVKESDLRMLQAEALRLSQSQTSLVMLASYILVKL